MFAVKLVYSHSKKAYFQVVNWLFAIPSGKHNCGALECDRICHDPFHRGGDGHKVHRPHYSCPFCRFRKMYYGKMPSRIEVEPCTVYLWKNRRHARIKNLIIHRLLNIVEALAN